MKRLGICQKCGKEKIVQDHHIHGYGEGHKDEVAPYCQSCDLKAHAKARKEGRCLLTYKEAQRKSIASSHRRSYKTKTLSSETMLPNVQLFEKIDINLNTGHISFSSYFYPSNRKKIYYIGEK